MIEGFSKLSRSEKIQAIGINEDSIKVLQNALTKDKEIADIIDELSENTISHYILPYGVAPNVLVNGQIYFLPLVSEESSVVAAISKAAKIWTAFGGFKAEIIDTQKLGHVHFFWHGDKEILIRKFADLKEFISLRVAPLNRKMKKRGGGIQSLSLIDKTATLDYYYQLEITFETVDAMGANFINSCLEEASKALKQFAACDTKINSDLLDVNMSILSNYTPNSRVKASVSCNIKKLDTYGLSLGIENYSQKFMSAVKIAEIDTYRAVTHNKGIFNGIDALAIATGNDWRAIEACGHAYASRSGKYVSLSKAYTQNNNFIFELEIPLSVGTVGGVTNLHPLAKVSLQLLNNPNAKELMMLIAVAGLAANFSAVSALISSGIQKGHMKMHLNNILLQLGANNEQKKLAIGYFSDKTISFSEVENWFKQLTNG